MLLLLAACSDYDLHKGDADHDVGDGDTDPVATDSDSVRDDSGDGTDSASDEDTIPHATAEIYVNDDTTLFTWDPAQHQLALVADFHDRNTHVACARMVDIAIDLQGRMYGTCGNWLVRVDPTDATFVDVLNLGEEYVGLTFLSDGRLILGGDGAVRIYDPSNGTMDVLYAGSFQTYAQSTLYGFTADGRILSIDPVTATPTLIQSSAHSWYGATTNPVRW
jgi:hypothetical protein